MIDRCPSDISKAYNINWKSSAARSVRLDSYEEIRHGSLERSVGFENGKCFVGCFISSRVSCSKHTRPEEQVAHSHLAKPFSLLSTNVFQYATSVRLLLDRYDLPIGRGSASTAW